MTLRNGVEFASALECLFVARKSIGGSTRKKIPSPIAEKAEEKDVEMEVSCHSGLSHCIA